MRSQCVAAMQLRTGGPLRAEADLRVAKRGPRSEGEILQGSPGSFGKGAKDGSFERSPFNCEPSNLYQLIFRLCFAPSSSGPVSLAPLSAQGRQWHTGAADSWAADRGRPTARRGR